ncbi:MAG: hypothetical protein IPM96_03255 [Ignavibacteria bacterium]|nr:hypothetical protein [Ignavibacteria bacterium]
MIPEFKNLNQQETELMFDAPALVTLLIAGAEGNIEEKETDWGSKIVHFRAKDNEGILQGYYTEVEKTFKDTLSQFIETFPDNAEERGELIKKELTKLNEILPKLNRNFAKMFYEDMRSMSKQIAKITGGIWGYGSISAEEQRYLDLEIINPVE